MNRFLRNVVRQRDHDQLLDDQRRMAELTLLTETQDCRVCEKRLTPNGATEDDGELPATVCTACGGRKRQAELEREGVIEPFKRPVLPEVSMPLIFFSAAEHPLQQPKPEVITMENLAKKVCNKGCGRELSAWNTRGFCGYNCAGKPAKSSEPTPRARRRESVVAPSPRTAPADVTTRFKIVAETLGFDTEELLHELMQGWLDGLRQTALVARSGSEDEP